MSTQLYGAFATSLPQIADPVPPPDPCGRLEPNVNEECRRWSSVCWTTTAILAACLCFTQLGMMLSLLAGRAGIAVVAPAGLGGALILGHWLSAKSGLTGCERWWPAVLALTVLAVSLAVSAWYFDLSVDGQWYHQTGIYSIARDWNPLAEPMRAFADHFEHCLRHYPKGPWYVSAAIYQATGSIECGKCQAVLGWVAMGLATFAAALDYGVSRTRSAAIALATSLNPVITSVLTAYLIEAILGSFLTVTIAALFSGFRCPRVAVIAAGLAAAIVTVNSKLTGLVFVCIALAAGGAWLLLFCRAKFCLYAALSAAVLLLAAVGFGYNPYITNTLYRHHPLYPVLGGPSNSKPDPEGNDPIERYEMPKNFLGRNRFVRHAYATFGRPGNAPYIGQRDAELMLPFMARKDDFRFYIYHETRVAGFGPYFSGALLMGLALGLSLLRRQPRSAATLTLTLTALTIIGSSLLSVHFWWPRFIPQAWLLAVLPAAFALGRPVSRRVLHTAWLLTVILLVNGLIVLAIRMAWETRATRTLRRQLTEIKQSGQQIAVSCPYYPESVPERFKTWGIRFEIQDREAIHNPRQLMGLVDGYPPEIGAFYGTRAAAPKPQPAAVSGGGAAP